MTDAAHRIAFQGVAGAFSHEACQACAPDLSPTPYASFEAVFAAVAQGVCERAFVPVANSSAGPVPEVAQLLPASGLAVLAEHAWPVRLQLMACAGARLDDIVEVASHPMALKQCARFLSARGWRAAPAFDTAGAAAELARTPDPKRAVVAARTASALYGLPILLEDVQDEADNVTRFLVLARPRDGAREQP
jgi:prephenate dehydratase